MPNPLFYRNIVALNRERHRALRRRAGLRDYGFAREANMIPALAEEFAAAAGNLPIAFVAGAQRPSAIFVTGLAPGSNLFVGASGGWEGAYLPAYLRRYPFIIGEVPGSDPVLCIDDGYDGFSASEGEPLFTDAGEPGPPVAEALAFAQRFRAAAERTDALAEALARLNLLRSVTLDAKSPSGQSTVVHGLLTVDEAAFDALPEADFLALRREGFLTPIYAHLFSLRAFEHLNARANAARAAA